MSGVVAGPRLGVRAIEATAEPSPMPIATASTDNPRPQRWDRYDKQVIHPSPDRGDARCFGHQMLTLAYAGAAPSPRGRG